jgi:bifunctional non-homologous end joining protein LigD
MKAVTATAAPTGDGWVYEPKWDGHRVFVRREGDRVDAVSSTGKPRLDRFPWLARAVVAATDHDVVLDGEVVAYHADGSHSFQGVGRADLIHGYVVFDLLALDGVELFGRPWSERRALLQANVRAVSPLTITPISDDAEAMEAATRNNRMEGIIAKRPDSIYQPGRRSPAWVKVKYRTEQEMVVGGYKLGEGNRAGSFGSLLIGVYTERGGDELRFAGAVGTGFTERTLAEVLAVLRPLETDECPFAAPPKLPRGSFRWVRPELVAQVAFMEWTEGGGIRAPVFLGLRDDKDPRDVVRET